MWVSGAGCVGDERGWEGGEGGRKGGECECECESECECECVRWRNKRKWVKERKEEQRR